MRVINFVAAESGPYKGTGKDPSGIDTYERNVAHEIGHNFDLQHPERGTNDGNVMHQGMEPNAGMRVTPAQINEMKNNSSIPGKLNKGKQRQ